VIDPIGGTRSFVIGNPTWSNLISLNYKGYPVLGLANFPVLKKYYLNYSDKTAYVVSNGKRKKISVNKKATISSVKVSAAFHGWLSPDKQKKIPQILKLMQFPCSDALSYSHLSEGRVDIVIQCSNKIWDIHPLIPIVKAAGGYISTWDNRDAVNAGNILVSSNKTIHNKFLKLLKPVSK
jgi:myo-inositol-1(or 4)-monophosphatase